VLLEEDREIEVVGEAWGAAALAAVREQAPDLLLLDVRMPGMDGFELLRRLDPGQTPYVVFVTAYDEYAVDAFDVRAIDYVLKPFTDARFREALERAKERWRLGERGAEALAFGLTQTLVRDAEDTAVAELHGDHLLLREGSGFLSIPYDEISWIEASGPYVQIHADEHTHLVRYSMKELSRLLMPGGFHRIHRSAIVNLRAVRVVQPLTHGDGLVVLRDNTKLRLSRSRREGFEARFFGGDQVPAS
jgi:two-component system LytT family response regulator